MKLAKRQRANSFYLLASTLRGVLANSRSFDDVLLPDKVDEPEPKPKRP